MPSIVSKQPSSINDHTYIDDYPQSSRKKRISSSAVLISSVANFTNSSFIFTYLIFTFLCTVNLTRFFLSSRSRPTLKPSTAIVSKTTEFVDIYTRPPTRPNPVYPQPTPDKTAAKCRKDVCLLPDCYCGGKDIPGKIFISIVYI